MQGSYVEMRDKIKTKKKDSERAKFQKEDRAWRNKRQNRHEIQQ